MRLMYYQRFGILWMFALLQSNLWAQIPAVMQESFSGPSTIFGLPDNQNSKFTLRDGKLQFDHWRDGTNWWYNFPTMDHKYDYVYEATFRIVKGKGYMGLLFSSSNTNQYVYLFGVSESGACEVFGWPKGTYTSFAKSQLKSFDAQKEHRLRVEKRQHDFFFFIDDQACGSLVNPRIFGKYFGIFSTGKLTYEIDDLALRQNYTKPAIKLAPGMPATVQKTNLGSDINSTANEKNPVISADGKTLFYVVDNYSENMGGNTDSDIFFSECDEQGKWKKRRTFGSPLNNKSHNCVISVTPDNNTLYLSGVYRGDQSYAGLSYTTRSAQGWNIPTDVKIANFYNLNQYEERCFAPNGKVLLLTLERDDSYGDKDLYVCFLQENNTWSEPKHMGPVLNTDDTELSPFIASDGTTLYFSSNGHSGYGNSDIFMSKRLDDTWTNWSEPLNLGPQINSNDFDAYFTLPASGSYAYMVSTYQTLGGIDIIRLDLPEVLRPRPVVLVSGKVYHAETKQPLQAAISYKELSSDREKGIAISSAIDGTYQIVLEADQVYSFLAKKDGYMATSEHIDTRKLTTYKELKQDLYLTPIQVGQTIRLNNVFFDIDQSQLKPESYGELNRVVQLLKSNPKMKIEVSGHTDSTGTDQKNKTLSQNRADAVVSYLIQQGIETTRIISKGYGSSKPMSGNSTDEGRRANRRVEFTIVEN